MLKFVNWARDLIDRIKKPPKNEATSSFVLRVAFHDANKPSERVSINMGKTLSSIVNPINFEPLPSTQNTNNFTASQKYLKKENEAAIPSSSKAILHDAIKSRETASTDFKKKVTSHHTCTEKKDDKPINVVKPVAYESKSCTQNISNFIATQNASKLTATQNASKLTATQNTSKFAATQNTSKFAATQNASKLTATQNSSYFTVAPKDLPSHPVKSNEEHHEKAYNYGNYYPEEIDLYFGQEIDYSTDEDIYYESDFEYDEGSDWYEDDSEYYQEQVKPRYVPWEEVQTTIKGTNDINRLIDPIKQYSVPKEYENLIRKNLEEKPVLNDEERRQWAKLVSKFGENLEGPSNSKTKSVGSEFGFTAVTKNNYRDFFHDLLYIEEQEQIFKLAQYNMDGVTMVTNGTKCTLEVPGLAEKRPSILKKDIIFVRLQNVPTVQYSGWVQEVQEKSIVIKGFSKQLLQQLETAQKMERNLLLDVRFTLARYPFFVQHRALALASKETLDSLFPKAEKCGCMPNFIATKKLKRIEFVDPSVEENEEQKQAIFNILQGKNLPAPYIIFGPPGTGKTITLVEAILQVKINFDDSHILVCAQSNSACNYIAEKLYESGECDEDEILRLTASGRMDEIPEEIIEISGSDIKNADKYRIIVCTLVSAGRFVESNYRRYDQEHTFTHLFIDEAGQAAESEALIAIGGLLKKPDWHSASGQLVLAGDPKQLGPICIGLKSKKFGLGVSLLERLMANIPIYQPDENGEYDKRYITQLIRNFRSHEQILTISNELFYDNKLIFEGIDDDLCYHSLSDDPEVGGFPIMFHGVQGQEIKEGRSPSLSNRMEILVVEDYIIKLLDADIAYQVFPDEIGVISPYALQVQKLKQAFQKHEGWEKIEVGSTETFQGREKRAIIVSTVRSKPDELSFDRKFRLGFVKEPKRFNVITTRAQSKLIVVGNPEVLKKDKCWSLLIQKAMENNSYTGCTFELETTYGGVISYIKPNQKAPWRPPKFNKRRRN